MRSSLPVATTFWASIVVTIVYVVLAVLMLRGIGWARIVYVVLLGIGILGMLVQHQMPALIVSAALKLIIFSFFLFSARANAYFGGHPAPTV